MPVRTPTPKQTTAASNLVSGMAGGLVVLAIGATLIGTGAINTGDTRREVIREVSTPAATLANPDGKSRSVAEIYRRAAPGVVFVSARIVTQADSPVGFPPHQE